MEECGQHDLLAASPLGYLFQVLMHRSNDHKQLRKATNLGQLAKI
jgi:hypothetical protein